jgi:hypothetical protein
MPERIIHIQWDGPFSLNQVPSLDDATKDRGVYQVYAYHPVYGPEQLVYIGQTWGQTFAARVSQHDWGGGTENDPHHVAIYIGRLKGERTPPEQDWSREIALAERLLIHSHGPAYNSTNIMAVSESDSDVRDVRILNWGRVRALHREVSGLMWTTAASQFDLLKVYNMAAIEGGSR